jgi:curved DNA-binding protein CbpA
LSSVLESAYLQLAAPSEAIDPYELLEIRPETSLEVAEAAYKAKVRKVHPDRGGSSEQMKALNRAIDEIRKKLK